MHYLLRCSANIFSCTCTNPGYCSYFKHDCTNTSVTAYYPTVPAPPSNPNHYPPVPPGNPAHYPPAPPGHAALPQRELSNAAAAFSSHLSTGLGFDHNLGYQQLTMEQLRNNTWVLIQADRMLQNGTQNEPLLNPLTGMGAALGVATNNVSTVDQLYAATKF